MSGEWQYQLRIDMPDEIAQVARRDPNDANLGPLPDILSKHHAQLKCQYDAFADYVAEAEQNGTEDYPLYQWTKDTIEQPAKQEKYQKSFTLYVEGDQVYPREKADALETELRPLVGGPLITHMSKLDTNPANSPQMPARYRK